MIWKRERERIEKWKKMYVIDLKKKEDLKNKQSKEGERLEKEKVNDLKKSWACK